MRLSNRLSLLLHGEVDLVPGDSSGLQKGLILLVENQPVCGEGVGFGVPALKYPDRTLFSSSASISVRNGGLVKRFSIDASPIRTWKNRLPMNNVFYRFIRRKLARAYVGNARIPSTLFSLMRLQSILGMRLSFERVKSKGFIEVIYRLLGDEVRITVSSSQLVDRGFEEIVVFNEQSADFDFYQDTLRVLRKDEIGAWKEVESESASLTNREKGVTFRVRKFPYAKLYRGRELLKPRLNWAGFSYSIPPRREDFSYAIFVEDNLVD